MTRSAPADRSAVCGSRRRLDWEVATAALLANAETYVHMTRTLRWTPEEYARWRRRTWRHLATVPSPAEE